MIISVSLLPVFSRASCLVFELRLLALGFRVKGFENLICTRPSGLIESLLTFKGSALLIGETIWGETYSCSITTAWSTTSISTPLKMENFSGFFSCMVNFWSLRPRSSLIRTNLSSIASYCGQFPSLVKAYIPSGLRLTIPALRMNKEEMYPDLLISFLTGLISVVVELGKTISHCKSLLEQVRGPTLKSSMMNSGSWASNFTLKVKSLALVNIAWTISIFASIDCPM